MESVKKRKRKPKSELEKTKATIRKLSPSHIVEVELKVSSFQGWKLKRINEHLRVIRNTVLGMLYTNFNQMERTKEYKRTQKQYKLVCETIVQSIDEKELKILNKRKKRIIQKICGYSKNI